MEIIKRICKLIDLKSLISISMVVSLCIGFFKGMITNEQFIPLVTMVLTFYFAKTDKKEETTEENEGR